MYLFIFLFQPTYLAQPSFHLNTTRTWMTRVQHLPCPSPWSLTRLTWSRKKRSCRHGPLPCPPYLQHCPPPATQPLWGPPLSSRASEPSSPPLYLKFSQDRVWALDSALLPAPVSKLYQLLLFIKNYEDAFMNHKWLQVIMPYFTEHKVMSLVLDVDIFCRYWLLH